MEKLNNRKKHFLIGTSAVLAVLLVWQVFSVTVFRDNRALPSPLEVFGRFFLEAGNVKFLKGIGSTFLKSLISFLISFLIGVGLAIASTFFGGFQSFIRPIISILRAIPTLGVTFILFMFYPGNVAAVIIAMLVSLPLVYTNSLSAINGVDKKLLQMAEVYRFSHSSKIKNIFIPSAMPHLHSLVKSGLPLNLKVIIAAEILAIPRLSIGSFLSNAYVSGDFELLYMWVLTAVLLSFFIEFVCDVLFKICMPYRYNTRQKLMHFALWVKKGGAFRSRAKLKEGGKND